MSINDLVAPLPYALREQVAGYSRAVSEGANDIFRRAGVAFDSGLAERFLFVATVRKLWTIIDGNYWLLSNSLHVMGPNVQGITYGGTAFTSQSKAMTELAQLRSELSTVLTQLGIADLVQSSSLQDILRVLSGRG